MSCMRYVVRCVSFGDPPELFRAFCDDGYDPGACCQVSPTDCNFLPAVVPIQFRHWFELQLLTEGTQRRDVEPAEDQIAHASISVNPVPAADLCIKL